MKARYVIITPAFNEQDNIRFTLDSVVKQTILPVEWIIVNDGSTDNTSAIVNEYTLKYPWIKLLDQQKQELEFGTHAVVLFYDGYKSISQINFDFVVKLDSDLDIDRTDFFEYQFKEFNNNNKLGICSGITYSIINGEKTITKGRAPWRTGGAMKVYRKECFDQIDGLVPIYGWDGMDEYKAMFHGWETKTFFNLHVNHLGKARALDRERLSWLSYNKGRSLYQRGYPIIFVFLKHLQLIRKKGLSNGIAFLKGYISAKNSHLKQYVNNEEKRFIRKFQYDRILKKIFSK